MLTNMLNNIPDHPSNSNVQIQIDREVFECCICCEPFSVPVFQCENGHTACSSCCLKMNHTCPMCKQPIGHIRCRALENLLDSLITRPCKYAKYGCQDTLSVANKNHHENECIYAPCICPHRNTGCNFLASLKDLSLHLSIQHEGSVRRFKYYNSFTIKLNVKDKRVVLQEENDDGTAIFVLYNKKIDHVGRLVSVTSVNPRSVKERFVFRVIAGCPERFVKLRSFTNTALDCVINGNAPSSGFLLIPYDFFDSCGQVQLEIKIRPERICLTNF